MEIISGIYKITSPSGKVYIGQSVNILKRWQDYKRYANNKSQPILFNSFSKHGVESHTFNIMHELPKDVSSEIMCTYEQFFIDQYKEAGANMMNVRDAGNRGKHSEETKAKQSLKATGRKHTPETLTKLSLAKKGKVGNRLGSKCSPEQIERNRMSRIGVKHTEETKIKISLNHSRHNKGQKQTPEAKEKSRLSRLGKKASEETRIKMSESAKRVIKTKEHNKKVSESLKLYHLKRKGLI